MTCRGEDLPFPTPLPSLSILENPHSLSPFFCFLSSSPSINPAKQVRLKNAQLSFSELP